jgi:salicylate hydroxylase
MGSQPAPQGGRAALSIAIVGGGLAGLTLSIGLSRYGIRHKIYEAAKGFSEIGAGIACGPNAVEALGLIDPRIKAAYDRCATYNESEERKRTWLTFRYGMDGKHRNGLAAADVKCVYPLAMS